MVIVVEGKNDYNKIKSVFADAHVFITNGSAVTKQLLDELDQVSKHQEIILCLDPDYPGEKIRKTILSRIPSAKNVYVLQEKAISKNKKKVGIEHMSEEDIKEAFLHVIEYEKQEPTLSYEEYLELKCCNNKQERIIICNKLHICYCNSKQLFKKLNLLGYTKRMIEEI